MKPKHGPDFSHLDSQAKVEAAGRTGDLEPLFLIPLEYGGADDESNILYVPIGVADVKAGIDRNVIGPLVDAGKVTQYRADAEYQGDSFVPISIKITAWEPGNFTTTINIWGDALSREQNS